MRPSFTAAEWTVGYPRQSMKVPKTAPWQRQRRTAAIRASLKARNSASVIPPDAMANSRCLPPVTCPTAGAKETDSSVEPVLWTDALDGLGLRSAPAKGAARDGKVEIVANVFCEQTPRSISCAALSYTLVHDREPQGAYPMTRAIRFHKTGGPEVLQWEEVEVGKPGPGEARVRNTAVGLNYFDTYFRSGLYPTTLPSGLGAEGAGVVEEVGPGVTDVKPGDRVAYGVGPIGAYSEARVMPADRLGWTVGSIYTWIFRGGAGSPVRSVGARAARFMTRRRTPGGIWISSSIARCCTRARRG